jgi:hypothetical protein
MRNKIVALIGASSLLIAAGPASAGLVVTTTNDANTLVGEIVGSGITTSGATYTGAAGASGTFTGGISAGLDFDAGIILTSGCASGAVGPNQFDSYGCANGLPGDAALDALIPGFTTYDATIFSFSFETAGGDLFFNFQFASEEYNEWVGSAFNDVFGLFLDGTNIALAPDGTTAVAINNVNCGDPYGSADNFCAYYNNNDLSDGGPFFNIEYDGFTSAFTAEALGLAAGTHTMTFAIADAGDYIYDSAIFVQAGSFSDKPTELPEPGTLALLGIGLVGLGLTRRRKKV